jgi:hypothetical protein
MEEADGGRIKILHIDRDFRGYYWIKQKSGLIRSVVPLPGIVRLLKSQHFDLIISEPHSLYLLDSPYK